MVDLSINDHRVYILTKQCYYSNFADAHRALELLEDYRKKLPPHNMELREALARAIIAIRSRLFQALLGMYIAPKRVSLLPHLLSHRNV